MPAIIEPSTRRLQLRQWNADDRPVFTAMCADPEVMKFFPKLLTRAEVDPLVDRCTQLIEERGWGFWAVETLETGNFLGFVGLNIPRDDLPCSPCVEIGWRLAREHWGRGYATEAASEALRVGFEQLDLEEIVSFAVVGNQRSRAVMERVGMSDTGQNFVHPDVSQYPRLREHCLYKISRKSWVENGA